ncbi:8800_t:CDS:2 [Cetraspora pellucida]|uniref:8800_t:CDS:1 n=1 Tax=Cetraspora pellucida TaxID=1433469 RepID=A0ACA9KC58_9GLOM|nr:8800_t:CDS:2 [Cetraspora pellucida]
MSNSNKKKRKISKTKAQSTSSIASVSSNNLSNPRANASFTQFFYQDDDTDDTLTYCKVCTQELDKLDGIEAQPYPYVKLGSSTGNLVKHLREKHHINPKNYKNNHGYLGVTITWLTSDFRLQEALISTHHMSYPHTGQDISEELFSVINKWGLINKVHTIVTDNGANMIKGVKLLKENHLSNINWQSCVAHTLQLSVKEGLKQIKPIHKRLRSIQAFFRLPKQAQRLRDTQLQMQIDSSDIVQSDAEDEIVNPLEVLTDCKTRAASKREGEKLLKLCLTTEEQDENGESFEAWINLIYGLEDSATDEDSSLSSDNEADIPSAGNRRQWQYAYRNAYRNKGCVNPRALKLLPFATAQEHEETEAQVRAELSLLEDQVTVSNNIEIERSSVTINDDFQDSLSAELWGTLSIPDNVITHDEFTRYMKEPIAHKNQNLLKW